MFIEKPNKEKELTRNLHDISANENILFKINEFILEKQEFLQNMAIYLGLFNIFFLSVFLLITFQSNVYFEHFINSNFTN